MDTDLSQDIKVRVLRMRKVPFMDGTGLNNLRNLWKRSNQKGITVVLSGVNENVHSYLAKAGFTKEIGEENICNHIIPAMARAEEILSKSNK
jgi:SulP family sulfate permease